MNVILENFYTIKAIYLNLTVNCNTIEHEFS